MQGSKGYKALRVSKGLGGTLHNPQRDIWLAGLGRVSMTLARPQRVISLAALIPPFIRLQTFNTD